MKNAQLLFAFCICLFCSVIKAQQSESPRKKINFNREWKYAHGDVPVSYTHLTLPTKLEV